LKRGTKSRAERLTTLIHLVGLGAGESFANISTKRLADSIGFSQQAASLRLIDLENAGLVQRAHSGRSLAVRLTDSGLKQVEAFIAKANTNLTRISGEINFRGTVFTGFNEGKYYVSLKGYSRNFLRGLGFEPYPGTLNLRLGNEAMVEQRRRLNYLTGIEIPGFKDGKRSFGPVKCFKARIGERQRGAVLAIERTHYDNTVLEVISPVNLRKGLSLKDGDDCSVTVYQD
jgi:riboflavin kinase, archaea type